MSETAIVTAYCTKDESVHVTGHGWTGGPAWQLQSVSVSGPSGEVTTIYSHVEVFADEARRTGMGTIIRTSPES